MTNDKIRADFETYYGAPLSEGTSAFTMNQHIAWEAWQVAARYYQLKWQPIETAPRDEPILGCTAKMKTRAGHDIGGDRYICEYVNDNGEGFYEGHWRNRTGYCIVFPTHWMRLQQLPTEKL